MSVKISPLQIPYPRPLDYSRQSVEEPGTRRPGQTGHYRNAIWGLETLYSQPHVRTVDNIFDLGLSLSENDRCLGHRPIVSANPLKFADHFVWETYAEVNEHRKNIGSAIYKLFKDGILGGGEYETVGIWSQNRPEWQEIDLALHAYAKVGVSLYDTLGKDSVEYVISHAHLSIVFTSAQHISSLLSLAPRLPMMRMVVCIDNLSLELKRLASSWASCVKIKFMDLDEIKELGKANRIEPIPATPDQICTINYTSGTTSTPKGVVLTHGNITSASVTNLHGIEFEDKGLLLSYLPLAHIYERINECNIFSNGGAIGYFTGDPLRLLEDVNILRPNYFPSVPRVLNRLYQGAMQAARAPGLRGSIFRTALEAKLKKYYETGDNTHPLWDRLVFRKVKAVLGGNIILMTSGSAPISTEALDFLKVGFACDVIEGYGMTENCGTSHRCWPNDPTSSGCVGALHPINEMKLIDIPAMNYSAEDKPFPRGEICLRGGNVFKFYYKDEKATRETLDEEGWMHTGDVGTIDDCGRLKIIDRVKNIMKLSQGEYIALEKIESVYSTNPLVAQICVYGDSLRDHVVAILVPEPALLAELAGKVHGAPVRADDLVALAAAAADGRVVSEVLKVLDEEARRAGLKGFEMIKKLHVTMDLFTPDNDLLTPTLKVKRRDVYAKYREVLDALYAEPALSIQPGSKL